MLQFGDDTLCNNIQNVLVIENIFKCLN